MKFTYDINNMREVFGTDVPEELAKRIKEYFSGEGIDVNVITTDDAVTVEFTPPPIRGQRRRRVQRYFRVVPGRAILRSKTPS